jgi:preprotein translocase subunit SecA
VMKLYRQREIEFPVRTAMARFMSDQPGVAPGSQRYNREGLYYWAAMRFPQASDRLHEDDFRTQSRHRLFEILTDISRSTYPTLSEEAINERLDEVFEGSNRPADAEDAKELSEWVKATFDLDVPESALAKANYEQAQQILWNAFDERYRPEMRQMERSLLLSQLDPTWKNHLLTMDYLRSGIGLRGWGQEDPKTVYKQEGMKEFKAMWESFEEKVTDTVFRMEETEAFQESLWTIGAAIHESAPRAAVQAAQQAATANSNGEVKVVEPIRNRREKVGRNDPCPCGSGKKYKNCHMRQAV